jgi:hypothetical protein
MQHRCILRRGGLSLVEVLVLIAAVLIMVGVVIPAILLMREREARSQSTNNLKQMSLAIANLSGNYFGKVPCGFGTLLMRTTIYDHREEEAQSFFFWLSHFIEQNSVEVYPPFDQPIRSYVAPCDFTNPGNTNANSYAVNARVFGGCTSRGPVATFPGTFNLKGTANVVTVFERYARLNGTWQGAPADNADGSCVLYGPHTDIGGAVKDPTFGLPPDDPNCTVTANGYTSWGVQVALADGSARLMAPSATGPYAGTTIWGWAISVTGPAEGQFGKAQPPAGW